MRVEGEVCEDAVNRREHLRLTRCGERLRVGSTRAHGVTQDSQRSGEGDAANPGVMAHLELVVEQVGYNLQYGISPCP